MVFHCRGLAPLCKLIFISLFFLTAIPVSLAGSVSVPELLGANITAAGSNQNRKKARVRKTRWSVIDVKNFSAAFAAVGASADDTPEEYRVILRKYRILAGAGFHTEIWFCPDPKPYSLRCYATGYGSDGSSMFSDLPEDRTDPLFYNGPGIKPTEFDLGGRTFTGANLAAFVQQMRICGNWDLEYNMLTHNCNSYSRAVLAALGMQNHPHFGELQQTGTAGGNHWLGHWIVSKQRCSGHKCIQWGSVSGCSHECTWFEDEDHKNEARCEIHGTFSSSASDNVKVDVNICTWMLFQMRLEKVAETFASAQKSLEKPSWGNFAAAEECRAKSNGQTCCENEAMTKNACDIYRCSNRTGLEYENLKTCCERNKGVVQCLTNEYTRGRDCSDEYGVLGSMAGLLLKQLR